ncbi:MAG TPA: hypothetical protein VGY66_04260 [Gemmataceae bacterium]|nr:hypothetical protein [Gemmataceae bacterium]
MRTCLIQEQETLGLWKDYPPCKRLGNAAVARQQWRGEDRRQLALTILLMVVQ